MRVWFRCSAHIPEPMELSNSGVAVVFYHLYSTMRKMSIDVMLEEPEGQALELWWGWDVLPSERRGPKALFTVGESHIEDIANWEEFDHIFVVSEYWKQRQHISRPLSVWPLGVDTEIFPVIDRNNLVFTFTHAGAAHYRKGSELVCQAFSDEFGNSEDVKLLMISPREGGEMFEHLQSKYSDCRNIAFSSTAHIRQETWRNYTGDCFVFPSRREGWGLCLTEAMSTGMPAIVSDLPAFGDIFNEDCGWLIGMDKSNIALGFGTPIIDSLRQILRYVYSNQEEAAGKGQYAAKFVRDKLTWEQGISTGFLPVAEGYGWL